MRAGLPDPLIDLLGARWSLGAPACGVAWLAGGRAAFALADGTVALAPSQWEGAASVRPRPGGGAELVPPQGAPPPVMRVGVTGGACTDVASDGEAAIVAGADGSVVRVAADGTTQTLADAGARVAAARGRHAWATGARCRRQDGTTLDLPDAVTALAFDPAGETLAIGHAHGVTVWSGHAERALPLGAAPEALAWSADGRHLAASRAAAVELWTLPDGAAQTLCHDRPPRGLSFSAGFLATGGETRVACWSLAGAAQRQLCGPPNTSLVTRVACHPARPLVAAGYENGAVLVCQPGAADLLFVRTAGGGELTALAWSPDGAHLALAVADGEVAVVAFPDLLFRAPAHTPRSEAA